MPVIFAADRFNPSVNWLNKRTKLLNNEMWRHQLLILIYCYLFNGVENDSIEMNWTWFKQSFDPVGGGNEVTWTDEIIDVIVVNFSFIVVHCYLLIVVVYLMALKWNRNELNLICGSSYGLIWVLSWVYSIY